jgi:hypothetical protein
MELWNLEYKQLVGLLRWTVGSVVRPLPTQTEKKSGQTSTPRVRYESMTPVFERAKIFHVLNLSTIFIECH